MTKTSESKLTTKKATKSAKSEQNTLPTKNISSKNGSINIQDRHLQETVVKTAKPALPLKITNARENNLKSISLELPHNSYIGVTGLSGSGKSSLAFDTVYAEGQRRYIETFSPYTRQFFDKVKKPDVDLIENVRPAIAIQQKTRVSNSRSTVGSLTDINDYLKILWANLSVAVCPECKIELKSWAPENLASLIGGQKHKVGTTYLLSAKIELPDPKSKNYKKEVALIFEKLSQQGFTRIFLPNKNEIIKIEDLDLNTDLHAPARASDRESEKHKTEIKNKNNYSNTIYIVLDRIRITEDFSKTFDKRRIQEAIKTAFILSDGSCSLIEQNASRFAFNWVDADNKIRKKPTFRVIEYFETPRCPSLANSIKFQKPKQSLFSYNHPLGACADCKGFGHILTLDLDLCIPDQSKTLSEKCIVSWATDSTKREHNELIKFCAENKIPINVPWRELSEEHQDLIYNAKTKNFWGLKHWFGWIEKRTYKMHYRIYLAKYRTQRVCETCNGTRLKRDALVYRIDGKTIADIWKIPVEEVYIWLQQIFKSKKAEETRALKDVYKAILARFKYLIDLGLGYLTLERQARTLSGGETQRVNLASAIGSELTSTQFVLDEPSVGLHARDSDRLTKSIKELHLRGNSVLAVEHDPDFLYASDYILELGPKSGKEGGEITFFDSSKKWQGIEFSQNVINANKRKIDQNTKLLKIRSNSDKNITLRNIKDLKLDIPLQRVVCLTGVSGSGKSTLVKEIIEKGYAQKKKGEEIDFEIDGLENFEQVLLVDQSPLAKSPRANIATYSGIWDTVRDILSKEESALSRGLTRSSFSFNVNAGRCTNCDGAGFIKEDMQFLSDVYIPCENCLGTRFQQTVLDVTYKEKNVHQILNTSIDECVEFFSEYINIVRSANYLSRLGLGHLTLGHSLSELSGGEAQRLKLVPFIERSSKSKSLLIFDEPTTGLHIKDIEKFIYLLRDLRDEGHSILCIEHNLSLILSSDWIIDLGPEGGKGGGKLVLQGTPEFAIEYGDSHTANYLREYKKSFYSENNSKKNPTTDIIDTISTNAIDTTSIEIKGARVHNLKNIDIKIPFNTIVAFTGVSGSGKSSIAKDIIYSEGQRRYLDCLSPYARQFIKGLERPDIDEIKNILPTVCVHQHTFQPGNLSTVGTVSEVYNFLRLLFAKTGDTYCPDHPEQKIDIFSAEKISAEIKSLGNKQIKILAPIIKQKKGNHKTVFERAIASEITEVRCDKIFARPGFFEEGLEKSKVHSIDFVIGKFIAQNVDLDITTDAVNQALALGGGELIVHYDNKDHIYSSERACPVCKRGFFKADPEDLSFNSKRGRCKKCGGTGSVKEKVVVSAIVASS